MSIDAHPSLDRSTGSLNFNGMPPWVCGCCGEAPILCTCGPESDSNRDYVIKGLPPPLPGSNPEQLLNRWVSVVRLSPALGDVRVWVSDNAATMLRAARERRDALLSIVRAYSRDGLQTEAVFPAWVRLMSPMWLAIRRTGWTERDQLDMIRKALESATLAFLAGDWTCITFGGLVMMVEAFPVKEEWSKHELLRDDAMMEDLFESAMFLRSYMLEGYSNRGWTLAIEDSADGACPPRWHDWYRQKMRDHI